ncbi:hypothetical protein ABGB17_20840 [Sphaerisporangium sp. B11E5]|uniref:hypothetical protein n=1 Tax=Sphaerisporangium sp. B11E5 TaxID=3153563 RepID=UPI00325EBC0C
MSGRHRPVQEIGSQGRPVGRHRPGRRPEKVTRRRFDADAIAQAAMLDQLEPGWLVWYGPYFRRFYAVAMSGKVGPLCVTARSCEALRTQMREAEAVVRVAVRA